MGCCGQTRRMWQTPQRRLRLDDNPKPPQLSGPVAMEYEGDSSIVVAGPVTGNAYVFPAAGRTLDVDGRDMDGLLALGGFSRA